MDALLNQQISRIMSFIVVVSTVVLMIHTSKGSLSLSLLLALYLIILGLRDYVWKLDLSSLAGTLLMYLQLCLAFILFLLSEDFFAQIYVLILIGEFTLHHSRLHSIIFTLISYGTCVFALLLYRNFPPFGQIFYIIPRVVEYLGIFGIGTLAKIAFQQKNQLASDHEKLKSASIELVRKTRLEERTRMARDIHDSVGHTLTSALTGLQTAAYAMEKSQFAVAQEMIDRTKDNILSSLDDVRSSVHLLRGTIPSHQLVPELITLIEDTQKQTQVEIVYNIDPAIPEDLSPLVELTIYRALQEGLTNGIRHGSSTSFQFALTCHNEQLHFRLFDNGKPHGPIQHGFGLNAMKERVEDVGGRLVVRIMGAAGGVALDIRIPLSKKTEKLE